MRLTETDPAHHRGLTVVALFEAFKGLIVLVAGCALLSFIHQDLQQAAERIVRHLHLNPASRIPRIFEKAAERANDSQILLLALGAAFYSTMRFVEAYGLWKNRRWAEWFALISSGIFLPVEVVEMIRRLNMVRFGLFAINVGIVLYLAHALYSSGRFRRRLVTIPPTKSDCAKESEPQLRG